MGWRFRRSIKVLPGVRLNFGKRGFTSTTVGKGIFSSNINSKGVRNNYHVPGTGLTYQDDRVPIGQGGSAGSNTGGLVAVVIGALFLLCGGLAWLMDSMHLASNTKPEVVVPEHSPSPSPTRSPAPKPIKKVKNPGCD